MLVFFDLLLLDDEPIMHRCLLERRRLLRGLIQPKVGRCQCSEWTFLDLRTDDGVVDLKQAFARSLAYRQEGLVLKPLDAPYFSLRDGEKEESSFIKLKKDYLADMGGQRDLGDFAVVGASLDPQLAPKTDVKPLLWTHFYLGCCTNDSAVCRLNVEPSFKVVACVTMDRCIPKNELKHLNAIGQFRQTCLRNDGSIAEYNIDHSNGLHRRMTVAFRKPFVVEILGSGYEKMQNETFEMLRHPRIKRVHHDRD